MLKLLNNKLLSVALIVAAVVYMVVKFPQCQSWWEFGDMFSFFMSAFLHLMGTMFTDMMPRQAKLFNIMSGIFLVLGIAQVLIFL